MLIPHPEHDPSSLAKASLLADAFFEGVEPIRYRGKGLLKVYPPVFSLLKGKGKGGAGKGAEGGGKVPALQGGKTLPGFL